MDSTRIADLLQPFLASPIPSPGHSDDERREEEAAVLAPAQLQHISTYIDLLLRWNARINLTAVRQPEEIVTRHFGESLFAARHLFPRPTWGRPSYLRSGQAELAARSLHLFDVGSGAGFPGLPIKIWEPAVRVTLIESNQKKATFLREVVRALTLTDIDVSPGRAEDCAASSADVVTFRAVECFKRALPIAVRLLAPQGRLALLIGQSQVEQARRSAASVLWQEPINVPESAAGVLLVGAMEPR